MKRLTNEIIDERLKDRPLVRIGNYVDRHTKIKWKCLVENCNYEWETTPASILIGNGCKKCAKQINITNEIVDERLKDRHIIRIGDYVNNNTEIEFKCLKHNRVWKAKPMNIFNGQNCLECGGKENLTNEIVSDRLQKKNITLMSEYKNAHSPLDLKCDVCDHKWTIKNLNSKINGCPSCNKNAKLTNEIIDERLKNVPIIRLGNYKNTHTKITWRCLNVGCDCEWEAKPSSILDGSGCPNCNDRIITNEIVDERLKNRNTKRVGNYINNDVEIQFKCTIHNVLWYAKPMAVFCGKDCPRCSEMKRINNETVDKRITGRPLVRIGDCENGKTKNLWKCLVENCGHEWFATPSNILKGKGCPLCLKKSEKKVKILLESIYTDILYQHSLKFNGRKYVVDFVVNGVFIEYNGRQHYEPIKHWGGEKAFIQQQKRDQELRDYCELNNIKLIEIPYWLSEEEQYNLIRENVS